MTAPNPAGWTPCPPGELGRLAAWLTFRRRLRTAAWAILAVVAAGGLTGAAVVAYPILSPSPPPAPGACHSEPPPPCYDTAPAEKK